MMRKGDRSISAFLRKGDRSTAIACDYLIVGAGLAGATCAYLLKKQGCDVLLLERQDASTKSKLCGGLMTNRSMTLAREYFGPEVEELFGQTFTRMHCVTEDHEVMVNDILMRSLYRADLDNFALNAYEEEGGKLLDNCHVTSIDFATKLVEARAGRDAATRQPLQIAYKTLIGADGAASQVRRLLYGKAPDAALSLEAECPNNGAELTMKYSVTLHGYSWYIPRGNGANIGCVSYLGGDDAPNLDEQLDRFAQRMGVEYHARRGALIPTGGDILLRRGSVCFLGDASGLICPPTGEGIYYALKTAGMLARALTTNTSYLSLMAEDVKEVKRQFKMRNLFFSRKFMGTSLTAAKATPYGAERAVKFALKHFAGFGD